MSRLQTPTTLVIDGAASLMAVNARVEDSEQTPIQFTIVNGMVEVRADATGDIIVHQFEFDLEDVSIGAEALPPNGLQLRSMSVKMDYPVLATPEWTTTTASAEFTISVTADWSAEFNGHVYSLQAIELPELLVQADLTLKDGVISAQVSGSQDGAFWNWANKFEMADLVVEVDASSLVR